MDKPTPSQPSPRAQDSPMAAAILGVLLVRQGSQDKDPSTTRAGHQLLQVAQAHWPTPVPAHKRLPVG